MTVEQLTYKCLKSVGLPLYLEEKTDKVEKDRYIVYLFDGDTIESFADDSAEQTETTIAVHLYCLKTDAEIFNLKKKIKKALVEFGFSEPEMTACITEDKYRHIALATNITMEVER